MKVLFTHTNKFDCQTLFNRKAVKLNLPNELNSHQIENAIVAFVCLEKGDDESKLSNFKNECMKILETLGVKNLVLFPFAHLSNNLLKFGLAKNLFDKMTNIMQLINNINIQTIPYGYDKSFDLSVKGHSYNVMWREL